MSYKEREELFNRFIVSEYLKYGSVDQIFSENDYNLPVSYPQVHRILNKWGIIKAAGPNSKLSEAICFMVLFTDKKIPVEKVYRSLPPSFKTSLSTIHRIMHNIKEGLIRRVGTALVITPENNKHAVLIGEDVSTPRLELGKPFGALSLPMGYSKQDEDGESSILRILQQEVFTNEAIAKNIPLGTIPSNPEPFMYLDIADVRVSVYHISLNEKYLSNGFSSFKLRNHTFLDPISFSDRVIKNKLRSGIEEIGLGYLNFINGVTAKSSLYKSQLNINISELALESL